MTITAEVADPTPPERGADVRVVPPVVFAAAFAIGALADRWHHVGVPGGRRARPVGVGLMAAGEVDSEAVARGIDWLAANQDADGLWGQEYYTGGGFPRVFYLRSHGYPKYFPLWAMARYCNLKRSNTKRVTVGM